MPTISWIGKDRVINHDKELPFRILRPIEELSVGKSENLLIEGDNLEALKALLPFYYEQIKCIYIDPPYNTGNEEWIYNDKVNSPQIKAWLNKVVGAEGEDLCRHDKWLCMMYPRLKLLKEFLKKDGVIFISIDDNEVDNLRKILDEIFGPNNFVATLIWRNVTDNNPTNIAVEHEYIHCYAKNKKNIETVWKSRISKVKDTLIEIGNELISKYENQDELQKAYTKWFRENKRFLGPLDRYKYIDRGGIFTGSQSVHNPGKEGYRYPVIHPETGKRCKEPLMGYRFPKTTMDNLLAEKKILFGKDENKIIELKLYVHEYVEKLPSVITMDGRLGNYDLRAIFSGEVKKFDNPKPVELLKLLFSYCTKEDDIILDSFAGSGTTGQAILELNKEDEGKRVFILVELESQIAKNVTARRLKTVIEGSKNILYPEGTGQGFTYLNLNGELYDSKSEINKAATYEDLASYIYYTETHTYLDLKNIQEPYIGGFGSKHFFLLLNKREENILDEKFLAQIQPYEGMKIIYAAKSLLDEEVCLEKQITFKQIPYELKKF